MTPQQEAAMRQALELINPIAHNSTDDPRGKAYEAIAALTAALEQPAQQEPVAWATQLGEYAHLHWGAKRPEYPMVYEIPLYTRPQAREPLSDAEIKRIAAKWFLSIWPLCNTFARAIEAAHGIKGDA